VIKVNLLAGERKKTKKQLFLVPAAHQLTVLCSLVLVAGAVAVAWRFTALTRESKRLDIDIAAAQQQTAQLQSIIAQVQTFEQQRAQLQQRVGLIEELRTKQTGPVHMLDQISRSLPPMLWLTELKQNPASGEVLLDGRCMTLTGLSDFVATLEGTGFFKKSIEIVSTVSEAAGPAASQSELIKFEIKATFQTPVDPAAPAVAPPAGGRSAAVNSPLKAGV
jgi:type IV pilus assembly protein PilN